MIKKKKPTCYIIAGPNGAGKTTFALRYLPQIAGCRNFVNADLITYGRLFYFSYGYLMRHFPEDEFANV